MGKNYFNSGYIIIFIFFRIEIIPKKPSYSQSGEDVVVITDRLLVVADGLGGWAYNGIDPSKYPIKLC